MLHEASFVEEPIFLQLKRQKLQLLEHKLQKLKLLKLKQKDPRNMWTVGSTT